MAGQPRIQGIDTLKLWASFAVICLHTAPFEYSAKYYSCPFLETLEIALYLLCRFAVPYFFIAAGFFFGKSLQQGTPCAVLYTKYAKRLLLVLSIWSLFYALFNQLLIHNIVSEGLGKGVGRTLYDSIITPILSHPVTLLLEGTGVHLWFIPALLISLTILYLCIALNIERLALPIALLLYVCGVLSGAYAKTPIGIHVAFNPRNGPFFGAFFTVFGWWLSGRKGVSFSFKTALLLTCTGVVVQFLEAFLLHYYTGINAYYDYSFGTILFGIGIFMIGLSKPSLGEGTLLVPLSQLSLGIYLVHPFFYYVLLYVKHLFQPLLWDFSISFMVFGLSALAVILLKKNSFTKKLVT